MCMSGLAGYIFAHHVCAQCSYVEVMSIPGIDSGNQTWQLYLLSHLTCLFTLIFLLFAKYLPGTGGEKT